MCRTVAHAAAAASARTQLAQPACASWPHGAPAHAHTLRARPTCRAPRRPPAAWSDPRARLPARRCAVQYLQPLVSAENATLPLELLASEKKAPDKNAAKFAQLVAALKASHAGASVAILQKESPAGEFATLFRGAVDASGLEKVELAPALADIMAVKDTTEQACLKRAAIFSAVVMQKHVVQKLEAVVDEEKKITHEKLAEETEDAFGEPAKLGVTAWSKWRLGGAMPGHHGLIRLHLKAWGCPPHS